MGLKAIYKCDGYKCLNEHVLNHGEPFNYESLPNDWALVEVENSNGCFCPSCVANGKKTDEIMEKFREEQ